MSGLYLIKTPVGVYIHYRANNELQAIFSSDHNIILCFIIIVTPAIIINLYFIILSNHSQIYSYLKYMFKLLSLVISDIKYVISNIEKFIRRIFNKYPWLYNVFLCILFFSIIFLYFL